MLARRPWETIWELVLVPLVSTLVGGRVDRRPCLTGGSALGLCLRGSLTLFFVPTDFSLGPTCGSRPPWTGPRTTYVGVMET